MLLFPCVRGGAGSRVGGCSQSFQIITFFSLMKWLHGRSTSLTGYDTKAVIGGVLLIT